MERLNVENFNGQEENRHEYQIAMSMIKVAAGMIAACCALVFLNSVQGKILRYKAVSSIGLPLDYATLGTLCYKTDDFKCARDSFAKSTQLDHKQITMLATSYKNLGQIKLAEKTYSQAIYQANGVNVNPAHLLAQLYLSQGKFKRTRRLIYKIHKKTGNRGLLVKELRQAKKRRRYLVAKK